MDEHEPFRLANSPETSQEVLEELSGHPSEAVRAALAFNKNAMLHLVGDESQHVLDNLTQSQSVFSNDGLEVSVCKYFRLRLANVEDSEFILGLRTDPELNKHVSGVDGDLESQIRWMKLYKERERQRKEFYFIIESKSGDPFGAVRLYDFKPGSFCWGSWMIRKGSPSSAAIESALSVYEFGFSVLRFHRSHFDVRKENLKVIKFHEKFGATRTHEDNDNYYFNFESTAYNETKQRYEKFFL